MKNFIDVGLRMTRDTNEKHRLYNPGQNSMKVYHLFGSPMCLSTYASLPSALKIGMASERYSKCK